MYSRIIVPCANNAQYFVLIVCNGMPFYVQEGTDACFCPYCGCKV